MALTPVEIRHVELRRTWFRGYRRGIVERLLSDIADSFEDVWRERADLADRLEELESEASKHRELESLLRATLVSAERAAQDVREQARRESDLIVQEARAEGRRVTRAAAAEKDRLEEEIRKIRVLLRSALEAIEAPDTEPKQDAAAPQKVEGVPDSGFRRLAG
jgi:cell division initiation protein